MSVNEHFRFPIRFRDNQFIPPEIPFEEHPITLEADIGCEDVWIMLPSGGARVALDSLEEAVMLARRVANGDWPPRPVTSRRIA
jgi:hypothetical protein